ncbi:MAG: AbrB/MazE/SpoVT family DNA-binding domain-containing protein [Candidatus Woykebacteria bacterium]
MENKNQEKWVKILGKGMLTLPKEWRDEAGIDTGDVVKAKKERNKIVIELKDQTKKVPYRTYTDSELDEFLKEDKLPKSLSERIDRFLSTAKNK